MDVTIEKVSDLAYKVRVNFNNGDDMTFRLQLSEATDDAAVKERAYFYAKTFLTTEPGSFGGGSR